MIKNGARIDCPSTLTTEHYKLFNTLLFSLSQAPTSVIIPIVLGVVITHTFVLVVVVVAFVIVIVVMPLLWALPPFLVCIPCYCCCHRRVSYS